MSKTTNQDEIHMTTPELIEAHGYVAETHQICTEDNYYLTVHRVLPNDRVPSVSNADIINIDATVMNSEDHNLSISAENYQLLKTSGYYISSSRLPVIINHGIVSSSADWVLLGPHKALAYVLCDNGYDVWLANARGNTYSKSHKYYSIKDRNFWDFSWHEIGYYDLPATIDYILEKTGHSKLYYIGYSQGATTFYVMGSERPEYNAKIKGMISLAPAVFLGNQKSSFLKLFAYFHNILDVMQWFQWGSYICNINQWLPSNKWQSFILRTFLSNAPHPMTKGFCNFCFYLIAGFGSEQLDKSMLPLIFGHSPAGSSVKQFLHFGQLICSGSFHKFDYGIKTNLSLYGSTQPPKYILERIKVPVAIFYSENDFINHHINVQKLTDDLPNVIQTEKIAYEKFNHIDYLWGRDARTILYNNIVTVLKKF
ncbi:PREDICTED: lipase 3-like [Atta colombica]|uniref:lipase 3-like n=1 Tax=Atta colombica TaxID=520822 RepID=UPI00084BE49C|nr:PREDICTED: lipase 3-like [Atta colombica]